MIPKKMTPYFIYDTLLRLREAPDSEEAPMQRRRIAAAIGDPIVLESLLGGLPLREEFYPDCTRQTPGTIDAIDTFLNNFGREQSGVPTGIPAIDALTAEKQPTEGEDEVSDEVKALRMIKNHQYRGAFAIIQALSLNNPEKSVYFADQMRFLKKLIFIEAQSRVGYASTKQYSINQ